MYCGILFNITNYCHFLKSHTANQEVMDQLWSTSQNIEFSYVRVLKLLYSEDNVVRLANSTTRHELK